MDESRPQYQYPQQDPNSPEYDPEFKPKRIRDLIKSDIVAPPEQMRLWDMIYGRPTRNPNEIVLPGLITTLGNRG